MEQSLFIEDFNYNLPDNRIAKYPQPKRDESKLLVYNHGSISQNYFFNITESLEPSALLIGNNTKVIQARLFFEKPTGSQIEIFCLEPVSTNDYVIAFQQKKTSTWRCLVGNIKKWKEEKLVMKFHYTSHEYNLMAEILSQTNDTFEIKFTWDNDLTFGELIELIGHMPIPPYLKREDEESDKQQYQTVYSLYKGSVAAPTAGLHFTQELLEKLKMKNILFDFITLHVGAGTFKPVKSNDVRNHEMHTEYFFVSRSSLKNILHNQEHITAVGTTSFRTLESLYWIGVKLIHNCQNPLQLSQWEETHLPQNIKVSESLEKIINFMELNSKEILSASTQIMIVPGYKIRLVKNLITNFHQPKSTLLLLIAAFIGDDWKKIYAYALDHDFRFLSYGDSSILTP